MLLAALKHIWIEGAVAEPGALVCSLAACPVSAQRLWGLSLSCTGLGDTLYPQLLFLTFVALPVFAPAAESRVPHCGTVCEAPAEDQGPCSHHIVSEAQAKPATLCEGVMARRALPHLFTLALSKGNILADTQAFPSSFLHVSLVV